MTQEEWIKKASKHLPDGGYNYDKLGTAIYMFKEGYEEAINEACEWLFGHLGLFVTYFDEEFVEEIDRSDFIKNFRKAMEE